MTFLIINPSFYFALFLIPSNIGSKLLSSAQAIGF
jgi:hypothetical protein